MRTHRSTTLRWLGAILAVAAVGLLWFEFAPTSIGGSAEYAVIDGISMNPKLHAGDLVLVRPASSYQVGDVVAYHNLQLGRLVLHRIVGTDGDTYVFKGDNNSFLDAYHPTQNQLVGKLWFHVPKVGNVFTWLHEPNHSALFVALVAVLVFAGGGAGAVRHRRRHGRRPERRTRTKRQAGPSTGAGPNPATGRLLLSAALTVGVIFGFVALIAFTHGKTSTTETPGGYTQQGTYAYGARVQPSPLYPNGRVTTGQTAFTNLVHQISTSFDYRFVSSLPHTITGTARLQQTLQSGTGWSKTLPSPAAERFTGDHVRLSGTLNLADLEQQLDQYAKLTGITNDSFTVVVAPTVAIAGAVDGTPTTTTFAPTALTFSLDANSLRLENTPVSTMPGATPASTNPLQPSEPGVLPQTQAASVRLLVTHVRVESARRIALLGLAVAALLALIGLMLFLRGGHDELSSIRRRSGDLLVPVSSPPISPAGGYIDVANFDSLAHLARSYELVILHHQSDGEHSFYIDDDGSIYRYRVRPGDDLSAERVQA